MEMQMLHIKIGSYSLWCW